jgi:hypothetical protein
MRTLVVTQNITLDGVVDAAGGWFDPTADGFDDVADVVQRQAAASDAFLVGRQTTRRQVFSASERVTTGVPPVVWDGWGRGA